MTRFLHTFPGGPTFFADGDGVLDVHLTDRLGQPWLAYRAQEGAVPGPDPQTGIHRHGLSTKGQFCRNTGLLKFPPVAESPWLASRPWYLHAVEPDYLLGRRGIRGWDGHYYDAGVCISIPKEKKPTWWDEVMMGFGDLPPGQQWLIGSLLALGIGVVEAASFGTFTPLLLAGTFSAGYGAYLYGDSRQAEYGQDDPYAPFLKAGGQIGMTVGGGGLAKPLWGPLAAAFPPLPYLAMGGYFGVEAVNAIRYPWSQKSWQQVVERWGPTAFFALLAAGAGLRALLPGGPRTTGNALRDALAIVNNNTFARRTGITATERRALIRLLVRLAGRGDLQYTFSGGSVRIGARTARMSVRFGRRGFYTRAGRIRHELAHVLQEIRSPGLLAREAGIAGRKLGFVDVLRAEFSAYWAQSGPLGVVQNVPLSLFSASWATHRVLPVGIGAGISIGIRAMYRERIDRMLVPVVEWYDGL